MRNKILSASLIFALLLFMPLWGTDREDQKDELIVAAVGDSITWGFAVENRLENSWPARLESLSDGELEVGNFGWSGTTLLQAGDKPYVESRAYSSALESSPRIVIIALGTNDANKANRPLVSGFSRDYALLIQSFRELESRPEIFICYPPPVFPNRWDIDTAFLEETIIPLIDRVAEENGVEIIDLHSPLKNRRDLIPDGVHPDGEGARIIAEAIYGELLESFISFL